MDTYDKLKSQFESEVRKGITRVERQGTSRDYQQFRDSFVRPHQTLYEQVCNFSERVFKLSPDKKKRPEVQRCIDTAHLQVTPEGTLSLSLLFPFIFIFIGGGLSFALTGSMFLVFFFLIFGGLGMLYFMSLPQFFADGWRLRGSNQMILAVFYIVTYMRHTSNIERAIEFAGDHLDPPMALDLKKILWDVENGRYTSIEGAMEEYLFSWRGYNDEFIESMHLIQGSLLEESEQRRLETLDKALDVILNQTYEKMLHYAHNLQSPITTLHMLGIILPILGLVILPLIVSFIDGSRWYHIATIYNVALPIIVYVMGKNILSKRPTGYGASDIEDSESAPKRSKNFPLFAAIGTFAILFIIGLSPLWMHWAGIPDIGFGEEIDPEISACGHAFCFMDYHQITNEESIDYGKVKGPFGLGAALIGLFMPLSLGMAFAVYFGLRTRGLLEIRKRTEQLEKEFAQAIFTLGNRLGDGIPPEMAFGKVASSMPNTDSGKFFMLVAYNIQKLGMGLEDAIFDPKHGALQTYPSALIQSSMKVLIESAKKGPHVASQALMNISRYLNEVHKVNERLQDLMGEVISSMKSQINFLTPIISGIVIGITSMISTILGRLSGTLTQVQSSTQTAAAGGAGSGLLTMFGEGIPTYFFQIIVGLYVFQLVYILTVLINGIEKGVDPLNERYLIGKNMLKSVGLYVLVALGIMIVFNTIAGSILSSI